MWRSDIFQPAFERAGMLQSAVYQPTGVATPFVCRLDQPDVLVLGDQQQTTDYEIEYRTDAIPRLRQGDELRITNAAGVTSLYRAIAHATTVRDGSYSRCNLTKAS